MKKILLNITDKTDINKLVLGLSVLEEDKLLTASNLRFLDAVYDNLPYPFNELKTQINDPQKRDMALLAALTVFSGIITNYYVHHGDNKEGPQIYTYVIGNPAQGKGYAAKWKRVGIKYHKYFTEKYQREYSQYIKEKKIFDSDPDKKDEPIKPKSNYLFLPANITKAALYSELADNNGYAIIFETEGDVIVSAIANPHGDFAVVLRISFHGEPISSIRQQLRELGAVEIDSVNISLFITSTLNQCFKLIPTGEDGLFSRFIYYILPPTSAFKSPYDNKIENNIDSFIDQIADYFAEIGKEDKKRNTKLEFVYTEKQKELYAVYWKNIDDKFQKQYSNKLNSNIHRFGLIFTRLAMSLTYLRHNKDKNLQEEKKIVCDQRDFDTVCLIVEKLMYHLQIIFHLYESQNSKQKEQSYIPTDFNEHKEIAKKQKIFRALDLNLKGLTERKISVQIFGDDKHSGTINKWINKFRNEPLPLPEAEALDLKAKEINVSETLEATKVSVFENVKTSVPWGELSLKELLNIDCENEVTKIRNSTNQNLKKNLKDKLLAYSPSGTFKGKRSKETLLYHSKFICIDIDGKDNDHIVNFKDLTSEFTKIINVAYCGLSVSGNGYFLLIPIEDANKHEAYFEAIAEVFKVMDINVDKACKDVSRLRIVSYDPHQYIAVTATRVYTTFENRPPEQFTILPDEELLEESKPDNNFDNDVQQKIKDLNNLVRRVLSRKIDITKNYSDWLAIGFALANDLGETGRKFFHKISSLYPKYNFKEANNKFTNCLSSNPKSQPRYTLKTVFWIAQKYDV